MQHILYHTHPTRENPCPDGCYWIYHGKPSISITGIQFSQCRWDTSPDSASTKVRRWRYKRRQWTLWKYIQNMAIFTKFAYFCLLFASFETVFGAAPSSHTTTTTTGPNSSTGGNDPRTIVVTSDRTQTKFITLSIADTKTVTTTVVLTSVVTSAQTTRETELITTTQIEAANSLRITVTQTVTATLVQTSRITALETATLDHTLSNVQTAVVTDTFTTTATEISVFPIILSSPNVS